MRQSTYSELEKLYSSAARFTASAFIQDPLVLDVVVNAPALTTQGVALARDRLKPLLGRFRPCKASREP